MRILFGITLAALILGFPLSAQDKVPPEKPAPEKKDDKAEAKPAANAKELTKEVMADISKWQSENKGGNRADLLKVVDAGFEKFLKAIEANPKADDVGEYVTASARFATGPKSTQKLAELVLEKTDLIKGEKPFAIIQALGARDEKFLDKVLEVNKSNDVVGFVSYLKATSMMARYKEEDKSAVLALVAKVPADLSVDLGTRKMDVGKLAAALPKKIEAIENLLVGKKMPELFSKDLDGGEVKLSALAGKVVVLDIWATWCPPCRAMIPHEREMVAKMKDKPFSLVSVSCDAELKTLKDFLAKEEMPWTHWHAGLKSELSTVLNIEHYPTIFVLDHKGVIRFKEIRGDELEKAVEKLVAEAEAK